MSFVLLSSASIDLRSCRGTKRVTEDNNTSNSVVREERLDRFLFITVLNQSFNAAPRARRIEGFKHIAIRR